MSLKNSSFCKSSLLGYSLFNKSFRHSFTRACLNPSCSSTLSKLSLSSKNSLGTDTKNSCPSSEMNQSIQLNFMATECNLENADCCSVRCFKGRWFSSGPVLTWYCCGVLINMLSLASSSKSSLPFAASLFSKGLSSSLTS